MTRQKATVETKQKMSETRKKNARSPNDDERFRIAKSNVNSATPNKKLDWKKVDEIRLLHRLGYRLCDIHKKFPYVTYACISGIVKGIRWKEEFRP